MTETINKRQASLKACLYHLIFRWQREYPNAGVGCTWAYTGDLIFETSYAVVIVVACSTGGVPVYVVGGIVSPENTEMIIGIKTVIGVAVVCLRHKYEYITLFQQTALEGGWSGGEGIVEDIISVRSQLTEVIYEIESYEENKLNM